jgi:hypothetical protein
VLAANRNPVADPMPAELDRMLPLSDTALHTAARSERGRRSSRPSVSSRGTRTILKEPETRRLKNRSHLARNRKFESISLQRRVHCEPLFNARQTGLDKQQAVQEKPALLACYREGINAHLMAAIAMAEERPGGLLMPNQSLQHSGRVLACSQLNTMMHVCRELCGGQPRPMLRRHRDRYQSWGSSRCQYPAAGRCDACACHARACRCRRLPSPR